jgi:uncharacterized protein with PQ loop repeat
VLATPPPPGGGQLLTSCCAFAACACFQVTSCCSKCVSTCLAGPGVIFLRARALQACFVLLHPCLRILLAIYSEATTCMRQLMCTAVSQLGQISSSHSIIMHISCTLHVYFSYIRNNLAHTTFSYVSDTMYTHVIYTHIYLLLYTYKEN